MPFISLIKSILERSIAKGKEVECPCCGRQARRFFPAGVVTKRPNARCAYCGSLERHRLIALMLKGSPFPKNASALCIAPEIPLNNFLKNASAVKITTSDLLRKDVDVQADVCKLPFADGSFDIVVANHVLEHVSDDIAAMRELRRVLKPGGRAILQTPVHWNLEKTDEDPSLDAAERLRRFGQDDHMRLYGRDFVQRLRSVDWDVKMIEVVKKFSSDEIKKYGLEVGEVFFNITRI